MASFFKKITKVLGSPVARAVAAGAGIVSAGGGFSGNVNVPFLGPVSGQTLAGVANVATAGADIANRGVRADNVAQLGLGGFNVLQNNAIPGTNVGNFGSVSQVLGQRAGTTVAATGAPGMSAGTATQPLTSSYTAPNSSALAPGGTAPLQPVEVRSLPAPMNGLDDEAGYSAQNEGRTLTPTRPASPVPPSQAGRAVVPGAAAATQVATAAPAAPAAPQSFGQRIVQGLAAQPIQTVGLALSLPSLFAPSPTDEAIQFYNERIQSAEAQVSLSSPAAQSWMANYTQQAEARLAEEYQLADSTLRVELAKRGMEDSTVANNARAKLEAEFAKKKIDIPMQAQINWLQAAAQQAGAVGNIVGTAAPIGAAIGGQTDVTPLVGTNFGRITSNMGVA